MTRPIFMESLKLLFPELENIPHNDTLMRLLSVIKVGEIEGALIAAVKKLIDNMKFARYPIVIDGTQKFVRDVLWSEECSEREVKDGEGSTTSQSEFLFEK